MEVGLISSTLWYIYTHVDYSVHSEFCIVVVLSGGSGPGPTPSIKIGS